MSQPNTHCFACGWDFFTPVAEQYKDVNPTIDCPYCGTHYDARTVECWTQIIWPAPTGHVPPS